MKSSNMLLSSWTLSNIKFRSSWTRTPEDKTFVKQLKNHLHCSPIEFAEKFPSSKEDLKLEYLTFLWLFVF